MEAYIFDWLNLLLRWLHVITAIAWIGSSFYFVWLDNSLTRPDDPDLLEKGVGGELWAVHGGGFYNPQKYLVAPDKGLYSHFAEGIAAAGVSVFVSAGSAAASAKSISPSRYC